MSRLLHRPIKVYPEGWLDPSRERRRSPFEASYSKTLNLLDRELFMLDVDEAIVQLGVKDRDVRVDGALRADVKVVHPGVIVTFESDQHGPLVYATDRFHHWHANLRAVALGLEALRKVERYGIAERGQQYAGYRELPSGIELGPATMTRDIAAKLIADALDSREISSSDVLRWWERDGDHWWRALAKVHHPDQGGDVTLFRQLDTARKTLDKEAA